MNLSVFIDNKYTKTYYAIINKAIALKRPRKGLRTYRRSRGIPVDYFEDHHIIPKSMGGNNKPDNYVPLTAKEHYICHLLLTKMCINPTDRYRMQVALFMMTKQFKNSRLYSSLRETYRSINRNANVGKIVSADTKALMSESAKRRGIGEAHRKAINLARCKPRQIVDPEGNVHTVTNIAEFCNEHDLSRQCVNAILLGQRKSLRSGWRAPS